jgi:hypothetical protein
MGNGKATASKSIEATIQIMYYGLANSITG